jgi:hypothetical protein
MSKPMARTARRQNLRITLQRQRVGFDLRSC